MLYIKFHSHSADVVFNDEQLMELTAAHTLKTEIIKKNLWKLFLKSFKTTHHRSSFFLVLSIKTSEAVNAPWA